VPRNQPSVSYSGAQSIQNAATRLVTAARRYEHIIPVLGQSHLHLCPATSGV